jgi:hypothetical protein
VFLAEEHQGHDHRDDEHRQEAELQHGVAENRLPLLDVGAELGGQDEDPPGRRDQTHDQEGLGDERVLPERDLHRVKELHDHQDEKEPVEKSDGDGRKVAGEESLSELDRPRDEERERARPKENPEADVDDVLDSGELTGDPLPGLVGFPPTRLLRRGRGDLLGD